MIVRTCADRTVARDELIRGKKKKRTKGNKLNKRSFGSSERSPTDSSMLVITIGEKLNLGRKKKEELNNKQTCKNSSTTITN